MQNCNLEFSLLKFKIQIKLQLAKIKLQIYLSIYNYVGKNENTKF